LVLILLILWITVIIAAYFVVQKPWPSLQNLAPVNTTLDIVLSFSVVVFCGGLGRWILGSPVTLSEIEGAALQLAVGVGVVGISILSLGLIGILWIWLLWVILVVGLILLRQQALEWIRSVYSLGNIYMRAGNLERFVAWVSIFLVAASFLYSLAPPLKWDSLVYHLELPRQYLSSGRIEFLPDNSFIGYPQLAEMVFTWAMGLRAGTTAATVGWFIGVIGLLGVGGFAGRIFGERSAFLAPAFLLSGVSISQGLSWAYVDLWVLLFGLCVVISLESFARSRNRSWILLGGIFAGFSISTKYTGGVVILLGGLLLFVDWLSTSRLSQSQSSEPNHSREPGANYQGDKFNFIWIVIFALIATVVFLPWIFKNITLTQSPVYPFLFPGRGFDELRLSFYTGDGTAQGIIDDLLIPLNATILGVEGKVGYNTSIGPLLLALIPGIAVGSSYFDKAEKDTIKRFLTMAIGAWIIWAIASHISGPLSRTRHYFGIFPVFALLASAGFEALSKIKVSKIRIGRLVASMVVLSLSLTALLEVFSYSSKNPHRVLLGFQSRNDYIAQELGWFSPVMDSVNELPAGSRVQFLWEARGYYCEVECSADVIIDRWWHLRRLTQSNDEIKELLEGDGITHVLIYNGGAAYEQESSSSFDDEDWVALNNFRDEKLSVLERYDGTYTLYKLAD
jgi:uncharacterized membrane protein